MTETKQKTTYRQPYTTARRKANDKWDAANTRKIMFKFMRERDADILEQLDKQPNKIDYLRRLIREDIAREQGNK